MDQPNETETLDIVTSKEEQKQNSRTAEMRSLRFLIRPGQFSPFVGWVVLSYLSWSRGDLDFLDAGIALAAAAAVDSDGRVAVQHHFAVLADSVPRSGRNLVSVFELVVFLGGPGQVITADLDVVVGEFTELVVIHTQQLGLFGCTEL